MSALQACLRRLGDVPLGTVVHLHPVDGTAVEEFLRRGATQVVMATCDPMVLDELRREWAGQPAVTVVDACLAPAAADVAWLRFNLRDASGLYPPARLTSVFPRLQLVERLPQKARALAPWLDAVAPRRDGERRDALVLDSPGMELQLLASLPAPALERFDHIVMRTVRDGLLKGGSSHGEAKAWLADRCYVPAVEDLDSDPSWPVSWLRFDRGAAERKALARRCKELEERLATSLRTSAEAAERAAAELALQTQARAQAEMQAASRAEEIDHLTNVTAEQRRQLADLDKWLAERDAELIDLHARHRALQEALVTAEAHVELLSELVPREGPR